MAEGRDNDPVRRGGFRSLVVLGAALLVGAVGLVVTVASPARAAIPSTTTVTTSGTPSLVGDTVTFTATVTSAGTSVTRGAVQFADGTSNLGPPIQVDASGVATLSTNALGVGTHEIFAKYGDTTFVFDQSSASVFQHVDNPTVVNGNTFCNEGPITIPSSGKAQPYPPNITVSGLSGKITDVIVTVKGLSHSYARDIDMLLAAPGGTRNLVLMSDAGGATGVSGVEVVFDDAAPSPLPVPITSGSYRPTQQTDAQDPIDAYPSPAPVPTDASMLATFDGSDPNGTWSLYVFDDAGGDEGSIAGGWCLTIRTPPATATALTSDSNPSRPGQSVTFTATVTTGSTPVTDGTVSFFDGGTPAGDGAPLATGVPLGPAGTATFTTSTLTAGTHIVFATHPATAGLGASVGALAQIVGATTTTTLTSDTNPSTFGQPVTFTATVTSDSSPVTDGSVSFADGSTTLASSVPLAADGTATFITSTLTLGTHKIAATYSGTRSVVGSTANLDQVITPATTTTTLTSNTNPSIVGQAVTFTATVTSGSTPVTNGTVSFTDGSTLLATGVPLTAGGTATFTTSTLTVGSHTIAASYSGTVSLLASSASVTQVVAKATTAATLTSNLNPSTFGEAVTFTATVTTGSTPVTAGTVSFTDGSTLLASGVPLTAGGTATFTTSTLTVGSHTISASYSGTASLEGSTATVVQIVNPAPTIPIPPPIITPTTTTTTTPAPTTTTPRPTTPPTVPPGGGLPPTGNDPSPMLLWAVALAAAGLALLVGAHRRRRATP
jgi:subtilisin-like proprotein convertase family protein